MAAGVIWNARGELLIAQRPAEGLLGGLWEFPAGRCAHGESLTACLTRALSEKLAVRVQIGDLLFVVQHAFTHFKITLHAFECRYPEGDPQPNGYVAWQWAPLDDLERLTFGRADRKIITYLRERPSRLF
jgi:A/G-specific adenine glycosylase